MRRARALVAASSLVLAVSGCGGDSGSPIGPGTPVPTTASVNAGDRQQAAGGASVPVAPSVIVRDAEGKPVSGVTVSFSVTAGGGTLTGGAPSTNSSGIATISSWTLGASGEQLLSAQVASLPAVVFEASIIPGTEQFVAAIGSGGGTFQISDPDNPYDGLTLTVPAGTVSGSTEWRMRVDEGPLGISLPTGFRIAGPAIEISTNQEFGGKLMTLEVPVEAGPGEVVFVALHDPITGVSEFMPTVDRTDSSVVVVTYHLRADFMSGAIPAAALLTGDRSVGFDGTAVAAGDELTARLVPMAIDNMENLLTTFMEFQTLLNRWPVQDHGSAAFPEGHGAGIAVLQAVGSIEGFPSFESIVKPLPTEGFYAEAGPLAVAQIAERTYGAPVRETVLEMQRIFRKHDKPTRDALVVQNVVANTSLNRKMAMLAGLSSFIDNKPVVGLVTGGSSGSLTLQSPASSNPTAVSVGADGLGTVRLPLVGDGEEHEVTELVPLNSFTYRTAEARALVATLGRLTQATTDSQRDAINTELATQAGLPDLGVEVQHLPEDAWVPSSELDRISVRSKVARLRVLLGPVTVHLPDGTEITRSSGDPMSVADDLGLASASAVTQVGRTISAYTTSVGGAIRQVAVAQARLTVAPFEVTPDEITLDTDNRTVDLEASVPVPPDGGFRIEWDWGDGEKSENLGLTTASHEYGGVGETYDIVATLMTNADRLRLAVDTVRVRAKPSIWVGSATVARTHHAPGFEGTLRAEATNLRLERVADVGSSAARFHVVSGQLIAWNEVPCAGYVSPISQATLTNTDMQWLVISETDPSAPDGSDSGPGLWYNANAYTGGLEILNKVCPSDFTPNPEAYRYATGVVWLNTHDGSGNIWTHSANRNVIQGSIVRHGTDNSTTVWTWRFERADDE